MRKGPRRGRRVTSDGPVLEARVEERLCYCLTFYRDGKPVGRAQLHRHGEEAMDIVDLYVVPEERGRGLGKAIVRQCAVVARTLGARVITAHTSPRNLPAYRLFLSLGFRPCQEEQHLERELDQPPGPEA
jgi:GNAT superfamily N-acetyltransferase